MKKLKYSVIGTSWITKSFIEGARMIHSLELFGVYSRSKERGEQFAVDVGAKEVFTSLEALALSDSDFIYVASPNVCHYEQCKYLLQHKKNIICEKPITVTSDEFRELFELSEENGVIYFEAIMYMHTPMRNILKTTLSRIGNISSASLDFSQLSSKYKALMDGELPNIFNPQMKTGALNDLGIYCVYPAVDLFGMPDKITAEQSFIHTGADGSGVAAFSYHGKLITITYSKTGQNRCGSQIYGDLGTVVINSISQLTGIRLYENGGGESVICGDMEKKYLMANEAQSMVNFITDFDRHKCFYYDCASMSEKVLLCLEKMRK